MRYCPRIHRLMPAIVAANPPDPSRAREIARAISARGLLSATLGIAMFFVQVDDVWPGKRGWNPLLAFFPLALYLGCYRFVNRYYERRFGWVEPASISNRTFVILMGTLIFLFFFGRHVEAALSGVGDYLDAMLSGFERPISWYPTVFWTYLLLLGAGSSTDRDWPRMTFLVAGTTLVTLMGMLPLWLPGCVQSVAWKLFQAGWLGLSLMALGFYDHIRLLLLLPKKEEGPTE
jgi:hypothetical protein